MFLQILSFKFPLKFDRSFEVIKNTKILKFEGDGMSYEPRFVFTDNQ